VSYLARSYPSCVSVVGCLAGSVGGGLALSVGVGVIVGGGEVGVTELLGSGDELGVGLCDPDPVGVGVTVGLGLADPEGRRGTSVR
jgi:hypothetical protein